MVRKDRTPWLISVAFLGGVTLMLGMGGNSDDSDQRKQDSIAVKTIETEKLTIREPRGKGTVVIGGSDKPGEGTALKFFDDHGTERLSLLVVPSNDYEPCVLLRDRAGQVRASVSVDPFGEPGIVLATADGSPSLLVKTSDDRGPIVLLMGKNGQSRAVLAGSSKASRDTKGAPKAGKQSDEKTEHGELRLLDSNGNTISSLPKEAE